MFCSIIIPTVARPVLERAVTSALNQAFTMEPFEVIVVNDAGHPLAAAPWMADGRVQVVDTNRVERCVSRNTGAALASGRYLLFLDDDDYLLPNALQAFWELARQSPAAWLYGATQLVDRNGSPLIRLHHGLTGNCFAQIMAGEWIPLQASIIAAGAFSAAGGFNPQAIYHEDVDLCRRVALLGEFDETQALVAVIGMGAEGSTTDHQEGIERARRGRETALADRRAFKRLHGSIQDAEWHGRVVRIYLTSLVWSLKHRAPGAALSRGLYTFASLALAGPHLLSGKFWSALGSAYASPTFEKGFIREKNYDSKHAITAQPHSSKH